jgi:D-alanyl-D-alanine carboxypeptidase
VSGSPAPGTVNTPSATRLVREALDARLELLRAKYGFPGISAAIRFADGSTWQGTAGLADVAARRPVTRDTAFSVASVSKTFTAALILALIEDGRLGLDAPAKAYVPTLPISPAITIRQLLDHTSGLRDFYYGPGVDRALRSKPARVWTTARSLSYVRKPFAKPGVSWHYSNTNYLILGMLAEAVGGAPVADQLRERFFGPLGLDHTWYQAVEAPAGPVAHGYRFTGTSTALPAIDLSARTSVVPYTSVVTASGAAGSIATTAGDLVRWAEALYGGDALTPASRDAMVRDIARTAMHKPTVPYGLGVQAVDVGGHRTLGHSGRFAGTRAAVRWLPDDGIAIAVLTNQSRRDVNPVLADLLRVALLPQPECRTCPLIP